MTVSAPLERKSQTFLVWIKDTSTKEESTVGIRAYTQFDAIVGVYMHWVDKCVDFQKYSFDAGEKLVLEHARKIKMVKERILDLSVHTHKLGVYQYTPESILKRKLEMLLKLEQPKRMSIWNSMVCSGCNGIIPERSNQVLKVRGGCYLCNYSCYALKLAKDHGH